MYCRRARLEEAIRDKKLAEAKVLESYPIVNGNRNAQCALYGIPSVSSVCVHYCPTHDTKWHDVQVIEREETRAKVAHTFTLSHIIRPLLDTVAPKPMPVGTMCAWAMRLVDDKTDPTWVLPMSQNSVRKVEEDARIKAEIEMKLAAEAPAAPPSPTSAQP